MSKKIFSTPLVVALVILLVSVVGYFAFVRESTVEEEPIIQVPISDSGDTAAPLLVGNNAIYVSDAKPAASLRVGFSILAGGGYVVVHEDREGKPGAIIGNSDMLSQGESRNFEVALSRKSVDTETLYAMLHSDNGDGIFNPADDPPIKDDQGNVVLMKFQVSNSAEEASVISL